jgi:hypothetical protein
MIDNPDEVSMNSLLCELIAPRTHCSAHFYRLIPPKIQNVATLEVKDRMTWPTATFLEDARHL